MTAVLRTTSADGSVMPVKSGALVTDTLHTHVSSVVVLTWTQPAPQPAGSAALGYVSFAQATRKMFPLFTRNMATVLFGSMMATRPLG